MWPQAGRLLSRGFTLSLLSELVKCAGGPTRRACRRCAVSLTAWPNGFALSHCWPDRPTRLGESISAFSGFPSPQAKKRVP